MGKGGKGGEGRGAPPILSDSQGLLDSAPRDLKVVGPGCACDHRC